VKKLLDTRLNKAPEWLTADVDFAISIPGIAVWIPMGRGNDRAPVSVGYGYRNRIGALDPRICKKGVPGPRKGFGSRKIALMCQQLSGILIFTKMARATANQRPGNKERVPGSKEANCNDKEDKPQIRLH
jgi:hypothetical protein